MGAYGVSAMGVGISRGLIQREQLNRDKAEESRKQRAFELAEEDRSISQSIDAAMLRFETTGDPAGFVDVYNTRIGDGKQIGAHQMQEDGTFRAWTGPGEYFDMTREELINTMLSLKDPGFRSRFEIASKEAQKAGASKTAAETAKQDRLDKREKIKGDNRIKLEELRQSGKKATAGKEVESEGVTEEGHPFMIHADGSKTIITDITVKDSSSTPKEMKVARDMSEAQGITLGEAYEIMFSAKGDKGRLELDWFNALEGQKGKDGKKLTTEQRRKMAKEAAGKISAANGGGAAGVSGAPSPLDPEKAIRENVNSFLTRHGMTKG